MNILAKDLLRRLWRRYRDRVPYVRTYEKLVSGKFRNDHIAFRTLACQEPGTGIASVSRVFQALGWEPAGCYSFPDKKLASMHFRHPDPAFPKLFVSELKVWELSPRSRRILERGVSRHRPALSGELLARAFAGGLKTAAGLDAHFRDLPWPLPQRRDVEALNEESQFGAWVLVHGYEVNHFTAAVDDIEKAVAALRKAGVPMKGEIEGRRGSKLRQSATEAAVVEVPVMEGPRRTRLAWTYAYFELAERRRGFEGFLGGQAAQLFEMTRLRPERAKRAEGVRKPA